ncbi:MAG: class I SAM-dependent methyltransferase [Caldilineae bacterium]|nr:MAG: class I SAM-dependent methyltransferase [Caldilineae bacterium]
MNFWNLAYLIRPPWDRGAPLEALVHLVEQGVLKPGRAIDIGCGTGTNAIFLAQRGFQVTGVDLAPRAIAKARRKAHEGGVQVEFLADDISRLPEHLGPFDLAVDVGCFHSLPGGLRPAYVETLQRLLSPGAYYLLWCVERERGGDKRQRFGPPGLRPGEIEAHFARQFTIQTLEDAGNGPLGGRVYLMERQGPALPA